VLISGQKVQGQKIESDSIYSPVKVKEHSPHKATMYSVLLPGLGQIYNKKYWKVPVLYAGIGVTLYAIGWNTDQYNRFKNAYVDYSNFLDYKNQPEGGELTEPSSKRYEEFNEGYDFSTVNPSYDTYFKKSLQNRKDSYKHDRDLSYIILLGIYVLNIIDATVDAHLTNFNINDNLSMTVQPKMNFSPVSGGTLGLSCRINF
jgi:hypothetical protein